MKPQESEADLQFLMILSLPLSCQDQKSKVTMNQSTRPSLYPYTKKVGKKQSDLVMSCNNLLYGTFTFFLER